MAITTTDPVSGSVISSSAWGHAVFTDLTNLNKKGFVADNTDTTSNTPTGSASTTEITQSSIQFTGTLGLRYKVLLEAPTEGDTANLAIVSRIRWKTTSTVDITGAELRKTQTYSDIINHTFGNVRLTGQFQPLATGTVTVVATIQNTTGGGTSKVKMNATVVPIYFLIEVF